MSIIEAYYRPHTIEEALQLLARPGMIPLAGGTSLVARLGARLGDGQVDGVVDLQSLGLSRFEPGDGTLTLGAMVRLQTMVDRVEVPPLVRAMAWREGPNTFRHVGTIGGVIAIADWESELYAALLVHEATVTYKTPGAEQHVPLAAFPATLPAGALITAITLQTGGASASDRVARTPADKAIVAALARRSDDGTLFLALSGVADRPILVAPDAVDRLQPPEDFRGSRSYRLEMAQLLSRRALANLS